MCVAQGDHAAASQNTQEPRCIEVDAKTAAAAAAAGDGDAGEHGAVRYSN